MKNKYNFYTLKLYLLISEHYQLKKCVRGRLLFWSFFLKKKLSLKREICTHMELLNPSQSRVVAHACPQHGTLWAEQLSQPLPALWMGTPCSNSCRIFHFLEGKAQPCSTPALPAHPTLPSFFSFPSSFVCSSAFSQPLSQASSPSLARPCAALPCSPVLLPLWAGAEQEPCHGQWQWHSSHHCLSHSAAMASNSDTTPALTSASPTLLPENSVNTLWGCGAPELLLYTVLFYNGSISHSNAADLPYCISLFLIRFCSLFLSPSKAEAAQSRGCSLC